MALSSAPKRTRPNSALAGAKHSHLILVFAHQQTILTKTVFLHDLVNTFLDPFAPNPLVSIARSSYSSPSLQSLARLDALPTSSPPLLAGFPTACRHLEVAGLAMPAAGLQTAAHPGPGLAGVIYWRVDKPFCANTSAELVPSTPTHRSPPSQRTLQHAAQAVRTNKGARTSLRSMRSHQEKASAGARSQTQVQPETTAFLRTKAGAVRNSRMAQSTCNE